ncbi:mitochondrial Complex V (CV) F1Fo ATP synthase Fo subunit F6 [Andalucia godoyi]|uniref:Mitochondrial Complex V (CV) F1Fo ATP synthase Fo subunit F6 n=1 Tax=Andalucia godoyi TaxID=505711 RepID=A0A8K0F4C1_ANDGO|nr:mitochondrial Complex V (CV) F1Fo ATP synthase Fo subunit F6 [Andalucia godoyi]|eukprot:ANDGO_04473.mRNA.1 mitochondrial Complex V (CV) F1Fo ATP synthase Fo subunit F6
MLFARRFASAPKLDIVQQAFIRKIRAFKAKLQAAESNSVKLPANVVASIDEEIASIKARDGLQHLSTKAPTEAKLGKEISSLF